MADFFNAVLNPPAQPPTVTPATTPEPVVRRRDFFSAVLNPLPSYLASQAADNKPWQDVELSLKNQYGGNSGIDVNGIVENYKQIEQGRKLDQAREKMSTVEENPLGWARRHVLPDMGAGSFVDSLYYKHAIERLQNGEATRKDFRNIARIERDRQYDAERSTFGQVGTALASVPALVLEFAAGGNAIKAGAPLVKRLPYVGKALTTARTAPLLTSQGLKQSLPAAGRNLATTAALPRFYLPGAAQNAETQGGNWYSAKNAGPAYALGYIQVAILGQLANKVQGGGLRSLGQRTAIGMGEQQGADLVGSAIADATNTPALSTHYGLLGNLARKEDRQFMQHGLVQAVTFGAFAAMHGRDPHAIPTAFANAIKKLRSGGKSAAGANAKVASSLDPIIEEINKNPSNPDLTAIHKIAKDAPADVQPFVDAVAEEVDAWGNLNTVGNRDLSGGDPGQLKPVEPPKVEPPKVEPPKVEPPKTGAKKLPWEMSPEELESSGVTFFRTAQGSLYALSKDGQTIRIKTLHKGHETTDVGMKKPSGKTYYVDQAGANEVGMWQMADFGTGGKARIVVKDGYAHLTSINSKTGKRGRDAEPIKLHEQFAIGLNPLELNHRRTSETPGAEYWSGSHPGNPIVEIVPASEAHGLFIAEAKRNGRNVYEPPTAKPLDTEKATVRLGRPDTRLVGKFGEAPRFRRHPLYDGSGKEIGEVQVHLSRDGVLDIHWIGLGNAAAGEQAGSLGNANVRSIIRQLAKAYPAAKQVSGLRAGGSHKGEQRTVDIDKFFPVDERSAAGETLMDRMKKKSRERPPVPVKIVAPDIKAKSPIDRVIPGEETLSDAEKEQDKLAERSGNELLAVLAGHDPAAVAEAVNGVEFSPIEKSVLAEVMKGRTYRDIAADPNILKPNGEPYTYAGISAIEKRLRSKLGVKQIIKNVADADNAINSKLAAVERGKFVTVAEKSENPEELSAVGEGRFAAQEATLSRHDELIDQLIQETQDAINEGRELSPERSAHFARELDRLGPDSQGKEKSSGDEVETETASPVPGPVATGEGSEGGSQTQDGPPTPKVVGDTRSQLADAITEYESLQESVKQITEAMKSDEVEAGSPEYEKLNAEYHRLITPVIEAHAKIKSLAAKLANETGDRFGLYKRTAGGRAKGELIGTFDQLEDAVANHRGEARKLGGADYDVSQAKPIKDELGNDAWAPHGRIGSTVVWVEPVKSKPATKGPSQDEPVPKKALKTPRGNSEDTAPTVGDETTIATPGGEVAARFEVHELDSVRASHFINKGGHISKRPAEEYPAGLQPRDYSKVTSEKEKVQKHAKEMLPGYYISHHPDATSGPPTITRKGSVVLNGNGRQMSLERAAQMGSLEKYKSYLIKHAVSFGIDPKAVEKMKRPALYRVVDMEPSSPDAHRFARSGNISSTQKQSPVRTAASLSSMIDDSIINQMQLDGETTFSEAVSDRTKGKAFRQALAYELPSTEVDHYLTKDHMLTDTGKEFVRNMLLAKILPVELIERLGSDLKAVKNSVEAALPQILKFERSYPTSSPVPALIEALDVWSKNDRIRSLDQADNMLAQGSLITGKKVVNISPAGRMMLDFLLEDGMKPRVFRRKLVGLATDLDSTTDGLFADAEIKPAESIAYALGVKERDGATFGSSQPKEPPGEALHAGIPLQITFLDGLLGKGIGIKSALKKWFTSAGHLPDAVFAEKLMSDARLGAYAQDVRNTEKDLKRAVGGSYDKLTDNQIKLLNAALGGDPAAMVQLPAEIKSVTRDMRDQIDVLSELLVASGAVSSHLEAAVDANIGVYMHRRYRVFDDPLWAKKVPEPIRNLFKAWLQGELPNATPEEIEARTKSLLYEGTAAESPIAFLAKSKLGSKDLSILTRRKDVPPELRALWGEYEDPLINYTNSIGKMSGLLTNHIFLTKVRAQGLGKFFFKEPNGDHITKIATEGSKVMEPLNGLYTTPEIKKAFEEMYAPENLSGVTKAYMRVLGLAKYAKTVGSSITHIRNYLGNVSFAIANGHFGVNKKLSAWKAIADDTPSGRAYYRRLIELGVIGQGIHEGEFRATVKDVLGAREITAGEVAGMISDRRIASWVRKGARIAEKAYHIEDAVWKIYGFENEVARYTKAKPQWSRRMVEDHAAEIIRDTYPTYSMTSRAVKSLRRFPVLGPFVSFPAEVVRTAYRTLRIGMQEMKNPSTRAIGATRLAGLSLAVSSASLVGMAMRAILGIDRDHEDASRRFLPEWSKNSPLLFLGRDSKGNLRYLDMGSTAPHSTLVEPLIAAMRSADAGDAASDAFLEAARPYLQEELVTERTIDSLRNKKTGGILGILRGDREQGPVYNQQSSPLDKAKAIGSHIGDVFVPGAADSFSRLRKAAAGEPDRYGRVRSTKDEVVSNMTGQRVQSLEVGLSLEFKARAFVRAKSDSMGALRSVTKSKGLVSQQDMANARAKMEISRRKVYESLRDDVVAAKKLGMSNQEIRSALRSARVSVDDVDDLIHGRYRPAERAPVRVR